EQEYDHGGRHRGGWPQNLSVQEISERGGHDLHAAEVDSVRREHGMKSVVLGGHASLGISDEHRLAGDVDVVLLAGWTVAGKQSVIRNGSDCSWRPVEIQVMAVRTLIKLEQGVQGTHVSLLFFVGDILLSPGIDSLL